MNVAISMAAAACLLSCYFAACHVALKTFSRKRLADLLEERGRLDRFEPFLDRLPRLLLITGALRTAFNFLVLLGALHAVLLWQPDWPALGRYGVAFVVAGVLVSVFGVAIPMSWARYRRERLLVRTMPVLNVVLFILLPVAAFLHVFDPIVRRISGAELETQDESQLADEVLSAVEEHEAGATVDQVQREMLEAVIELPTTTAGEIMTPRTDVKGIEVSSTLEQVKAAIMDFGHSRIPVYEENLDHIVGILYAKDLIRYLGDGEAFDLRAVLREAFMVPETKSVRELLAEFKGRKVHLAIVLDEYGGTAGLVTIEDILEEIVGDIRDEYELVEEPPQITRLDGNTVEIDARVRIDDLNDALDVELPEDEDYDTLGGFVFAQLGHIPEQGETFEFDNLRFTVTEAERTKVRRVKVEHLTPQPASSPHNGNGG